MKQRYIKVNRELIPVTEELYQIASQWKEKERNRARRDGECGQSDYRYCKGDCNTCGWRTSGHRNISLNELMEDHADDKNAEFIDTNPLVEDIVSDQLLLEQLYQQLDQLIPNGARVFQMRANHFSEREIAQTLGIKAQSTLNYRIRKMDDYIRAHREEIEDLLR